MKDYSAIIGVYVRTYAYVNVTAKNDKAALAAAIAKFKNDASDIAWQDTDFDAQALPAVCSIYNETDDRDTEHQGVNFAQNTDDSRDFVSAEMLALVDHIAKLSFKHSNSPHFADDCIDTLHSLRTWAKKISKRAHAGEKYKDA